MLYSLRKKYNELKFNTYGRVERTGLVSEEAIGVYKTAACATALTIVPAFAITLLLFMGLLNYGN